MKSETIMFIHGMCVTPLFWEQWVDYLQAKGYRCIAPAWPGRDKPIDALRGSHPDPQLGRLTLADVVEHHINVIRELVHRGGNTPTVCHAERSEASRP